MSLRFTLRVVKADEEIMSLIEVNLVIFLVRLQDKTGKVSQLLVPSDQYRKTKQKKWMNY